MLPAGANALCHRLHSPRRFQMASCIATPAALSTQLPIRAATAVRHLSDDIAYVLFPEQQIHARVQQLGRQLAHDYADRAPLVLGVLTGAFQVCGDLVRSMDPCPRGTTVNFVRASSYGSGTESSGKVAIKMDMDSKLIKGRHVVLVEDIVDTGMTLTRLKAHLTENCEAASVAIVALLDKRERRKVELEADYVGFQCPNEFVVGYGLDFDEEYRTLPYIGVLKPECYAHKL
ncbi:hypothetical protein QJQ45_028662 [Haematococcus lacustris]|nr:hypothetical protein QJQ45_028662 [Haematococcus lacustris]